MPDQDTFLLSRRTLLTASAAIASGAVLSGCTTSPSTERDTDDDQSDSFASMYGPMPQERFPIPAVDLNRIKPRFYRRLVDDPTDEKPGTIVVDTRRFYLYLVRPNGKAMRYGVGLGRAGFAWSGRATIAWKQAWPKWTPPDEMIARQPDLEKWSAKNGGMPAGLTNPLGARALYIFDDGVDTLYRLHGTPEYWTIGSAVSSGCVRLINQDVIDLYERVSSGAPIVVR